MTATANSGPSFAESILQSTRYRLTKYSTRPKDLIRYSIVFDKKINYISEIYGMLDTIRGTIESTLRVTENKDSVKIELENTGRAVYSEVDLILMFFSATHYDCTVIAEASGRVVKTKIVDGYVYDVPPSKQDLKA